MVPSDSTCWTLVRAAASGHKRDREDFVRLYAPLVRAYLTARWTGTPRLDDLDDAVQEVFLDCFRNGGVLERCEQDRPGGFRAFLYGVTRVIALRLERSEARRDAGVRGDIDLERIEHDAPSLSRVFDRAWVISLLREASLLLARRAEARGEEALRRVKLLRARFEEGLPTGPRVPGSAPRGAGSIRGSAVADPTSAERPERPRGRVAAERACVPARLAAVAAAACARPRAG